MSGSHVPSAELTRPDAAVHFGIWKDSLTIGYQ
jgi:hypothetical protein